MRISYDQFRYGACRCMNLKLFLPDDGKVQQYVAALHGFAGSMESWAISALAERLTGHRTAVLAFNYAGHGNDEQDALFSLQCCRNVFCSLGAYAKMLFPESDWSGIFATSFGGYLTLLSMADIPDNIQIVLRAPAVNMADVFSRIVEQEGSGMVSYQQSGSVQLGYDHRLDVPYSFYEELCRNDIFMQQFDRKMLLFHGDCDDVVLPEFIADFCSRNPKITHQVITGADHRFLHPGELDRVMDAAVPWLLSGKCV